MGKRYFKLAVTGSDVDLPPFSTDQISSAPDSLYNTLCNAGVNVFTGTAKNQLLALLEAHRPEPPSFKVATRLGWNSGAVVRPDETIGVPTTTLERAFGNLDQQMLAKYRVRGTLEEWQTNIVSFCAGNSRLIFALSLAFTGPILRFVRGPRGGGFQLWGKRETGKTTAAMVAGSVWGCHRGGNREIGFAETWHTTANQLEITALAHNDCLLILDETGQAGSNDPERAQVVTTMVMTLAQLREKQRMTNVGPARSWRCYFLSTSNFTLDGLAQRGKVALDDAQRSRLTDVPLPSAGKGIYEDLHGFVSGAEFTDDLVPRCRKYCGAAGLEFQRRLVEERNLKQLRKLLSRWRTKYVRNLKAKAQAEGLEPLQRSTGRSATVYAAGRLAIQYGIIAWPKKELLQAILSCQLDGLRAAKTEHLATDPSVSDLRRKLVEYLRERRREFMNLDDDRPGQDEHQFGSVPGYVATFKVEKWFYLTADQLVGILGKGENADRLKKELVSDEMMDRASNGRYLVQRPIFSGVKGNKGHKWVHAFRAASLNAKMRINGRLIPQGDFGASPSRVDHEQKIVELEL